MDVALPLGAYYYLLHQALGLGVATSLALSGVVPAVRTIVSVVGNRVFNGLATPMPLINMAGIATGNDRGAWMDDRPSRVAYRRL
ncbi:hypothetical protein ACQPYK_39720 [Streptosporangium sp. CA-135522]|uniref:hypothetical protein n=1 Tax=Streptosporangium sp. CA-135522 TaxID=3240072 RepID=UPI003D8BF357